MALKRWIFPGLAAGIAAAIVALPLSWVVPFFVPDTIPSLNYSGTVWSGTVSEIPVFETGNLTFHPLTVTADLEAGDGLSYLKAGLSRTSATDVSLVVDVSNLPITDQRLQGLVGTVRANLPLVGYGPGGCTEAQGTVRTDLLQRNGGAVNWTGPELSGPVTCEGGSLIATLTGRDAQQTVEAVMRFSPDGTYRADITARTSREEAGAILPLFGFTREGRDFKLTEQGKWR